MPRSMGKRVGGENGAGGRMHGERRAGATAKQRSVLVEHEKQNGKTFNNAPEL